MKMELSVKERLTLLMVIPKQGSMITMRLIHSLRELVDFSDEEHVRWMPTICYDLNDGCPRCKANEWEDIPFAPIQECKGCGFEVGKGPPGNTTWRTLDDEGQPISEIAEVEFGEAAMNLIADTLNLFNTNEELNDDLVPLYEKFVEEQGAIVEG